MHNFKCLSFDFPGKIRDKYLALKKKSYKKKPFQFCISVYFQTLNIMKSFAILVALYLIHAAEASEEKPQAEVKLLVVQNINDYLQANPNATLIPLQMSHQAKLSQNLYSIGARRPGDRLVGTDSGWAQYPSKQNLELSVWYPSNGVGAVVTYVQILITQDTGTSGKGYVTAGGIGQRYIKIIVEAWNTAYARYDYSLYGI